MPLYDEFFDKTETKAAICGLISSACHMLTHECRWRLSLSSSTDGLFVSVPRCLISLHQRPETLECVQNYVPA